MPERRRYAGVVLSVTPLGEFFLRIDRLASRIVDRRPGVPAACPYEFRTGMRGAYARHAIAEMALGALREPDLVTAALRLMPAPTPEAMGLTEAHVSTFLFGAWSTVETLVYAANALGFAIAPHAFRSLEVASELRATSPNDVWGGNTKKAPPGYALHFPRMRQAFLDHETALRFIECTHSVSKHRRPVMTGGDMDLPGLDAIPVEYRDYALQAAIARRPMQRVYLDPDPKSPLESRDREAAPVTLDDAAAGWRTALRAVLQGLSDDVEALP